MFDECLESLLNQSYPKDKYEIIVVDSSDDVTDELIESYQEKAKKYGIRLKYLYQEPKGLAAARNLGIENAEGEILCFTDDDCIADRYWIEKLVEGFDNEKIGGVGGGIVTYERTLVEKCIPKVRPDIYISNWAFIIGANMAYRKKVLRQIGGFDPLFRYGGDDNDIGLRVRLKGYKLKFVPNATIYFRQRTSLVDLVSQHYGYGRGLSRIYKKFPNFPLIGHVVRLIVFQFFYPFLFIFKGYKKKLLCALINSIAMWAYIFGMLIGLVLEKYPEDRVITSKLDFLKIH